MSQPVPIGDVLPGVLAEVVDRAGVGYERWMELVAQAGYCHHPICVAGRVDQADRQTGEVRQVYDSGRKPDGVLPSPAGRWWSCPAARRGPSRPQRGPRRSKQTRRPGGRPGLGWGDGGAPPGTRTPNRCLKRALLCQLS